MRKKKGYAAQACDDVGSGKDWCLDATWQFLTVPCQQGLGQHPSGSLVYGRALGAARPESRALDKVADEVTLSAWRGIAELQNICAGAEIFDAWSRLDLSRPIF